MDDLNEEQRALVPKGNSIIIQQEGNSLIVGETGNPDGTFANGQILHPGDRIRMGDLVLAVEDAILYPRYRAAQRRLARRANSALIAEIIGGILGCLGIGHIISGRLALGLGAMVSWWGMLLLVVYIGYYEVGHFAWLYAPLYLGLPIASGVVARDHVLGRDWEQRPQLPGGGYAGLHAGDEYYELGEGEWE